MDDSTISSFAHVVGVLSDRRVARLAGVSPGSVMAWRQRRNIPRAGVAGRRITMLTRAVLATLPPARLFREPLSLTDRRLIREAVALHAGQRALARHFCVPVATIQLALNEPYR